MLEIKERFLKGDTFEVFTIETGEFAGLPIGAIRMHQGAFEVYNIADDYDLSLPFVVTWSYQAAWTYLIGTAYYVVGRKLALAAN